MSVTDPGRRWEKLSVCGYGVASDHTLDGYDDCGDPAEYRVSWDDGKSWLYLCERHARQVEEGEQS